MKVDGEGAKTAMKRAGNWILAAVAGTLACESTEVADPLTLGQAIAILREVSDLTEWIDEGTNMERCPLGGGARIVYTECYRESADTSWIAGHWDITLGVSVLRILRRRRV